MTFPAIPLTTGVTLLLLGFFLSLQLEPTLGDIPVMLIVTGAASIGFGLGWVARGDENECKRGNRDN